ncbi:MAG: colicin M resistance protein CbrA [Clostridiales bacterium GWF2_36_10]|nr:MAG: colicin M resistance protein CbrA [Clostridiales bacterium GWF2_36_10]HAN21226.1 FAD-binding protein [Clostridiales bacterium]
MLNSYDIIIIGAGPAGATFARIAEKSQKILLIDGSSDGKPCGGLLAPDAQKALACFDLTLPREVLVDPQIFSVRTIDLKTKQQRWYQRLYINVDRKKFDNWLVSLSPFNVTKEKGICFKIQKENDGYIVTYKNSSGETINAYGKNLIGADGANSIVRRSFFPKLHTRQYVAIQQWFEEEREIAKPFYSCIFDADTTDCCSWSISKDGYIIFGGAFAPKNCRSIFENQKEKLIKFGFPLNNPVKTEACMVLRPNSLKSFCCGGDGIFLIGEAAGFISPSSLEGISYAINSAVMLNNALLSDKKDKHKEYKRATKSLRLKLIVKNLKCPLMYDPYLRKIIMKSGFSSIEIYQK